MELQEISLRKGRGGPESASYCGTRGGGTGVHLSWRVKGEKKWSQT